MKIKNRYIENLKKEDISFYAHPIKYGLKDYERVLDKIRRKAEKTKEILSVYTFGHVSVPGISDIDLIFVLKEGSRLPSFLRRTYTDKDSSYLVFHPFFIITEDIMKNMRYIYPNSNFIKIYGNEIAVLKKPAWKNFSGRVNNLRKNWFRLNEKPREAELFDLLKEAVYVSMDFVTEFNAFLSRDKNNLINAKKQNIIFKGNKNRISFVKEWNNERAVSQMINHFVKYKNFYSILPISLLNQLCCYSSADGRLSRYIKKRLSIKCMQSNIDPIIKKRIQILNDQVEYANKLKHSHYPCFFPLGYKTERGFKNKLILAFILITSSSAFRRILFSFRSLFRNH